MTDTPILAVAPSPSPKALVLITRTTICDCGERFSAPELYERHQPSGHWNLRNILHLRRLHSLPEWRLPIERQAVSERIPFCDYCLALGAPLDGLPLPPNPKATVGGLGGSSTGRMTTDGSHIEEVEKKPRPKVAARPPIMTLEEIFR